MKNRRRLIIVILSVAILVSIAMPVMARPVGSLLPGTVERGFFRYYGSFRQEQFKAEAQVVGGTAFVAAAWRKSNGNLTCVGTYVFMFVDDTRKVTSGWADHPTSYEPGACKVR
jgi:hypothetical protein